MSQRAVAETPSDHREDAGEETPPLPERPWIWHLDRAASLALVVLLPVHLASFHLQPEAAPLTEGTLLVRWDGPWRMVDWATIVLAVLHGGLSLQRRALGAPEPSPGARALATGAVVLIAVVIAVFSYVVFSFGLF